MKPVLDNEYGYKVCYKNKHNQYVHRFLTKTYKQAQITKNNYYKYPPNDICDMEIKAWYVIPIKKREVLNGIWRKAPF